MPSLYTKTGGIFVHIPKTGGSTISNILQDSIKYVDACPPTAIDDAYLHLHATAKMLLDHTVSTDPKPNRMFTIVRNPYTRFISAFCMAKNIIKDFPYECSANGISQFCRDAKSSLMSHNIFKPMTFYTHDETVNVCLVHHVYKYESFDEAVESACKLVGISNNTVTPIPILNTNLHIDNAQYWQILNSDSCIIDFVNNVYVNDFTAFGYMKL
jgi:hypothetical protein